jgi:hypothetical protein
LLLAPIAATWHVVKHQTHSGGVYLALVRVNFAAGIAATDLQDRDNDKKQGSLNDFPTGFKRGHPLSL